MFGVDSTELLIVAVLALLFIGPKELPGTMRSVGRVVGQIRATARHFTSGVREMVREAELEEMERKWREENERIMREHPAITHESSVSPDEPALPLGDTPPSPRPPDAHDLP